MCMIVGTVQSLESNQMLKFGRFGSVLLILLLIACRTAPDTPISADDRFISGIALGPGFHSTDTCYSYFGIKP